MFPNTYFPPSYFPPAYFPEGTGTPAPYVPRYAGPPSSLWWWLLNRRNASSLSPDFLSALVAYWEATPALTAISPNPFFGIAPPGKPYPIVRLTLVSSVTGAWNSLEQYTLLEDYQISIYDINLDNVARYANTVVRYFDRIYDPGSLTFSDGDQLEFFQVNKNLTKEPNAARGGTAWIYCQSYTYRATIHKVRGT